MAADPNISKFLDAKALAHTFDLRRQLRAVDAIFRRVFGEQSTAAAERIQRMFQCAVPPTKNRVTQTGNVRAPLLLNALDVAAFGSVDFDFVALADERRNVDHEPGLELRRLHHRARGGFLNGLLGFNHG